MEERILRLEADSQRRNEELATLVKKVNLIEDQVAQLLLQNSINQANPNLNMGAPPTELHKRLSSVALELNSLVPALSNLIPENTSSTVFQTGGGNWRHANVNMGVPFPNVNYSGVPRMFSEINNGHYYPEMQNLVHHPELNVAPQWNGVFGNGSISVGPSQVFTFGTNPTLRNSSSISNLPNASAESTHGSKSINRDIADDNESEKNEKMPDKYVPPARRLNFSHEIQDLQSDATAHWRETSKGIAPKNQFLSRLVPLMPTPVKFVGQSSATKKEKKAAKAKAKQPQSSDCQRLCDGKPAHKCGKTHDKGTPCPPCLHVVSGVKLKCGHQAKVLCSRKDKIADTCSECDSKQIAGLRNIDTHSRQMTLGVDPMRSPEEVAIMKFRDLLNKSNGLNYRQITPDLIDALAVNRSHLITMAQIFLEKVLSDTSNSAVTLDYAVLISHLVKSITHREVLATFDKEVRNLLFEIYAVAFKLSVGSSTCKQFLQKKSVASPDSKKRNLYILKFVGELYLQNFLHVLEIQTHIINPVLDLLSGENLDYLCKLLNLIGLKLETEINGSENQHVSNLKTWLSSLYTLLEGYATSVEIDAETRTAVENIVRLRKADWDRSKRQSFETCNSHVPSAPSVAPKQRKRKSKTADTESTNSHSSQSSLTHHTLPLPGVGKTNVSSDLDAWINGDWGDATDPLAVASAPLPSSGMCYASDFNINRTNGRNSATGAVAVSSSLESHQIVATRSTASSSSSSTSSKVSAKKTTKPLSTTTLFEIYAAQDTQKKAQRIKWIKTNLKGYTRKQLKKFLVELTFLLQNITVHSKVTALGHLVDFMLLCKLVNEDEVLCAFSSAVATSKNWNPERLVAYIKDCSYYIVTVFNDRLSELALNWVAKILSLLKPLKYESANSLVIEILAEIRQRYQDQKLKKLWADSSANTKKSLSFARVNFPSANLV